VGGVAVSREIDELEAEPARELRDGSPAGHSGVGVDRHAVANGEVDTDLFFSYRPRIGAAVRANDRVRSKRDAATGRLRGLGSRLYPIRKRPEGGPSAPRRMSGQQRQA
jgi:hypothetical protein